MPQIDELASIIGILSAFIGFLTWILKIWIINPLGMQIKELNDNFSTLNTALSDSQKDYSDLEKRVSDHDVHFAKIDTKIGNIN